MTEAMEGHVDAGPTILYAMPIRNDDIRKWVVPTCDVDPGTDPIVTLSASIGVLVMEHVQKMCPLVGPLIASDVAMLILVTSDGTASQSG